MPNWPEGPVRPFMKGDRTEKGPSGPSGQFGPVRAFSKITVLNRQLRPKTAEKTVNSRNFGKPYVQGQESCHKISERGFRDSLGDAESLSHGEKCRFTDHRPTNFRPPTNWLLKTGVGSVGDVTDRPTTDCRSLLVGSVPTLALQLFLRGRIPELRQETHSWRINRRVWAEVSIFD